MNQREDKICPECNSNWIIEDPKNNFECNECGHGWNE